MTDIALPIRELLLLCLWLLAGNTLQAQEGMQMQYFLEDRCMVQPADVLRENRVKEIRYLLVPAGSDSVVEGNPERIFVLERGFDDDFGDARVRIDSMSGQVTQLVSRGPNNVRVIRDFHYNEQGRLQKEGTTSLHLSSGRVSLVDSVFYWYTPEGRLDQHLTGEYSLAWKRYRSIFEYDEKGRLREEKMYRDVNQGKKLVRDSLILVVHFRHSEDGRVTEQYCNGKRVAWDSLAYVPDGRLLRHLAWDTLRTRRAATYWAEDFGPDGKLRVRKTHTPFENRKKTFQFSYNEYGLLLQYSFFDDRNRLMVVELHYDFYTK